MWFIGREFILFPLIQRYFEKFGIFQKQNKKYINSIDYIISMTSTISISEEMKEKLRNLGKAGDSFEDVIRRMYEATKKTLLLQYLYDESDSLTIEEAKAQLKNG